MLETMYGIVFLIFGIEVVMLVAFLLWEAWRNLKK